MNLYKLNCFYEVARQGNYELAAKTLGKSSISVGQNVRDLEKYLGCLLFRRGYRGLTLTEDGKILLEGASKIFKEAQVLENTLRSRGDEPTHLKLLATVGITSDWLSNFIPSFLEKQPNVTLEISSLTSMAAFDFYQYDIYIGEIFKKDPKFVYTFLKNFHYNFYASAQYIEKYGCPRTIEDLKDHRLIDFNIRRVTDFYKSTDFFEAINTEGRNKISIDSTIGEFKLAQEGVGIACLCDELSFLKESNLVPVLKEMKSLTIEIYFVYHGSLRDNKIVKALLKEIKSHI